MTEKSYLLLVTFMLLGVGMIALGVLSQVGVSWWVRSIIAFPMGYMIGVTAHEIAKHLGGL